MALSYKEYPGDGVTLNWTITFPYLDRTHVKVKVDGVVTAFTFLSDTLIQISPAVASGAVIRIFRESVPGTSLLTFQNGYISNEELQKAYDHARYLSEEAVDRAGDTFGLTGTSQWDAQSKRITAVANGNDPQDAVTKAQLDAVAAGAGQVPTPANPADNGKILTANAGTFAFQNPAAGDGLELVGTTPRVKSDGPTIARSAAGIKVADGSLGLNQLSLSIAHVLDKPTAIVSTANIAVETDLYRFTIPGGTLGTNRSVRLILWGDILNNTGVSQNIAFNVYFGATTIQSQVSIAFTTSASRRNLRLEVELNAAGLTNSQISQVHRMTTGPTGEGSGNVPVTDNLLNRHYTIAEDSTLDKDLAIRILHVVADPNLAVRRLRARLELWP